MSNVVSTKLADDITPDSLPALVDRAAQTLAGARTAAEVLEAREMAGAVYDLAKRQARIVRAKQAHDDVLGAVYRAQADALEIEARAKRRLADEYDAEQAAGNLPTRGGNRVDSCNGGKLSDSKFDPNTTRSGLTHQEIFEGRNISAAERRQPGIVRKTLDKRLAAKREPTRTAVRHAVRIAHEHRKPHVESVTILEDDSLTADEADQSIRETARYVWGTFLNPPPGIRACLREAMARASPGDVRVISAAAEFLTELKDAANERPQTAKVSR